MWIVHSQNSLCAPRQVRNSSEKRTCVLVVDDDHDLCEVVREMLVGNGFTVLVSENGSTALRIVEEHAAFIDLLLTDIHMPQMAGPELAKRVSLLRPEMRVLFMSADPSAAISSGELSSDAPILAKPFSSKVLVRNLRDALRQ